MTIIYLLEKDRKPTYILLLTAVLLTSIFIPYHDNGDLSSNLHLIFAYSAFILFNLTYITLIQSNYKMLCIYILVLFTCGLICLVAGSINGISEAIFGSYISIALTLYYLKEKADLN